MPTAAASRLASWRSARFDSEQVHSPEEFFEAANKLETTFNMAYIDSENIAYFSTGRLPILAPGTDPSLPTLGNGEYNWQRLPLAEQHPHEVNPASDTLLSWNNKPAPEWGAASENFSYGPVHRVQLFTGSRRRRDRGQRSSDHEQGRHAGPARGEGLADDRAGARRRPGAEQTRRTKRRAWSTNGSKKARACTA